MGEKSRECTWIPKSNINVAKMTHVYEFEVLS